MITSDIDCYSLGGMESLNAKDTTICMGASIRMGHGAQKVFDRFGEDRRAVAVIGDSTFFHTGMNSLLQVVYNRSNTITCILDNRITGMNGHQENPGTGFTLQGMPTKIVDIETVVRALGVDQVKVVNPIKLDEMKAAIEWTMGLDEPSVIITRWACVLKKFSEHDKQEFGNYMGKCIVDVENCIGCKMCVKTCCPALRFDKATKIVEIDKNQCVACKVCLQVCPQVQYWVLAAAVV